MSQSLEKGTDESQEAYEARLKKRVETADHEANRQEGEAKKWKNIAVAAILLILFFIGYMLLLFWNDSAGVKQVLSTSAGEIKTLKAETRSCTAPNTSPEVTALSKALSECLAKLPNSLPYQPAAPTAAPASKQQKKLDTKPGKVTPSPTDAKPSSPAPAMSQPTHCRWASDGSLRLKKATSLLPADPLKEIPRDIIVETVPKENLKQGETCQTWQKAMEAEHADLQPRNKVTLHK